MAQDDKGVFTLTHPATLTFPNLMEAKPFTKNGKVAGEPKFSGNFEFSADHPDLKALKTKAAEVAKAKWPTRKLADLVFPFMSGDNLAEKAKAKGKDREFSRGKAILSARSKFRPNMAVLEGGKIVDLDSDALIQLHGRKFYSGVEALCGVTFVAYEGIGANPDGVNAYLNLVMSLNKGARLTSGTSAAEVFKGYVGTVSNDDPTAGAELEDEISF